MKIVEITTIIPTYNGEKFIADAIQSINKQTYPVKEIIVVDDGSTDDTEKIVKQQTGNIRFIKQEHTGMPSAGRNRGINEATGEFIAFLDQDDFWCENKLALQVEKINLSEKPDVVVGLTKIVNLTEDKYDLKLEKRYENGFIFLLSAALFRKSVFQKVGIFNEQMKYYGSDTEWLFRAREYQILFYFQKDIVLYWNRHSQNQMDGLPTWQKSIMEMMMISIKRRKKNGKGKVTPLPKFNIIYESNTIKFLQ